MKNSLFVLLILLLTACASPKVFYDYDRQADFSNYQNYSYYSEMDTGLSDFDAERVRVAIDSVMSRKGIAKSKSPDFKINFYASYFKRPSQNRLFLGMSGGGGNVGVGVSGGIPVGGPESYMSLTIELVEWPSNVLFWQTVIESKFDPDMKPAERNKYFQKLIGRALKEYPPE